MAAMAHVPMFDFNLEFDLASRSARRLSNPSFLSFQFALAAPEMAVVLPTSLSRSTLGRMSSKGLEAAAALASPLDAATFLRSAQVRVGSGAAWPSTLA